MFTGSSIHPTPLTTLRAVWPAAAWVPPWSGGATTPSGPWSRTATQEVASNWTNFTGTADPWGTFSEAPCRKNRFNLSPFSHRRMKLRSKPWKLGLKLENRWTGWWGSWKKGAKGKEKRKRPTSLTTELDPVTPRVEVAASAAIVPPYKSPREAFSRNWRFPRTSHLLVESQSAVFLPAVLLHISFHPNLSLILSPPSDPVVSIAIPSSVLSRKTMRGFGLSWTSILSGVRKGEWPLARFVARPWQVQSP